MQIVTITLYIKFKAESVNVLFKTAFMTEKNAINQIGLTGSRCHFGARKTTEWCPLSDSSITRVAIG